MSFQGLSPRAILCCTAVACTKLAADAYSSNTVIASSPKKEIHDP